MIKDTFKRVSKCLSEIDPFYKASFTTQISRIRFNRELMHRRKRSHCVFG